MFLGNKFKNRKNFVPVPAQNMHKNAVFKQKYTPNCIHHF